MQQSASGTAGGNAPWTSVEVAFLFNYADVCLQDHSLYKDTVSEELARFTNKKVELKIIERKLYRLLVANGPGYSGSVTTFLREGTKHLAFQKLPKPIFEEMKQQRHKLGLGDLDGEDFAEDKVTLDCTSNMATDINWRAATRGAGGSRKTYGEQTVPESEGSFDEDPTDGDFNEEPVTQGQTQSLLVVAQDPRHKHAFTASMNTVGPLEQLLHTKTALPSLPPDIPTTGQKRKADAIDVIDLGSQSPPPAEQQVPEKDKVEERTGVLLLTHNGCNVPSQDLSSKSAHNKIVYGSKQRLVIVKPRPVAPVKSAPVHTAPQFPLVVRSPATPVEHTTRDMVKDLSHLVGLLIRDRILGGRGITEEMERRLINITRTSDREPGELFANVLRDLHAADAANKDLRDLLRDLVGRREYNRGNEFPSTPDKADIEKAWKDMRQYIKDAFGHDPDFEPTPSGVGSGYIAARIEDLAKDGRELLGPQEIYIERLSPFLASPHSAHAIVSALFCRWLFAAPEPMFQDVYSDKELKIYETLLLSEGPAEVQHFDKFSSKLLFEHEKFIEGPVKQRAVKQLANIAFALKHAWPAAPGFARLNDPLGWVGATVKLKQTLMISPMDYRVHYCMPGIPFDPAWMHAEDAELFEVKDPKGKMVLTCLFPALFEQEPQPFGTNPSVKEVLVSNKKFFPSYAEKKARDPKRVIAKAVVLVT